MKPGQDAGTRSSQYVNPGDGNRRFFLALSGAAQGILQARTIEGVCHATGEELRNLGFRTFIFLPTDHPSELALAYQTIDPELVNRIEKALHLTLREFRLSLYKNEIPIQVLSAGTARYVPDLTERITHALPGLAQKPVHAIASLLGFKQAIYAPLHLAEGGSGLLIVTGEGLGEGDLDSLTAFSNQTAIALDNARLYEEIEAASVRLEERIEQRTRELAFSERRFRASFEQAAVGIAHVLPDGSFLRINQRFCDIVGYSREEMLARTFQEITHPDDLESDLEYVAQVLSGELQTYSMEKRYVRKGGSEVWVNLTVSLVREEDGGPGYFISVVEDISKRKAMEAALSSLNAELEERVLERTTALRKANKELEAFSYSVSHDLRAPLRAIDGFSRILVEEYPGALPDEAQRYLKLIRGNTQRMGQLIDDLLDFSRLSRQPLEKIHLDPTEIVRDVIEELRGDASGNRVDFRIRSLPRCQADPRLLRQVFTNLLSNALKFTAKREKPRVEIGAQYIAGKAVYYVRDNGVGFDMKYIDKLFGVFQRLHRPEEYKGTGVGLATVQRIIHRHGGRVWAEAEINQGATFCFTLGGSINDDQTGD